jgi:hypothetical protein
MQISHIGVANQPQHQPFMAISHNMQQQTQLQQT